MAPKSKKPSLKAQLLLALVTFVAVCALLGSAALGIHYYAWTSTALLDESDAVTLVIPDNTTWDGVVEILADHGLVTRPLYFQLWARNRELPPNVKSGAYLFQGPLSLEDLDRALRKGGAVEEVSLTVPEGFTIFHIADRVERIGLASRASFLAAARDPEALQEAGIQGESFEGYLFPDTYRFVKGTPADLIVQKLHDRHTEVVAELSTAHPDAIETLGSKYAFDMHSIVTMASIVEKESSGTSEQPIIARVFYNRLDRDMKLQTDPTCVYGEQTYKEVPHPRYCKDPLNRYSTYVIEGLPPGPISNPGRGALEAALQPDESEDARAYLFFVARRDGSRGHHFSKTYREHKAAIRKFLKGR